MSARWKFLAEATALFDASLDSEATIRSVVERTVPRMADCCVYVTLGDDGAIRWEHAAHRRPGRAAVTAALQAYAPRRDVPGGLFADALRSREAQLRPVVDDALLVRLAADDAHLALLRRLDPVSWMAVPLVARGRVLGVLGFVTTAESGRHYAARDLDLARRLGARAALAVDHDVLNATAQRTARARDELLAVVSHDLRNPLSTVQLAARFLVEEVVPDDAGHATEREQLVAVLSASGRMQRLVDDLLDLSRADAGPLRVDPVPRAPGALVAEAVDAQRTLGAARGVAVAAGGLPALPAVLADSDRVAQIFGNLIGNALKFTPAGGRVTVSAAEAPGPPGETHPHIRFAVCDTGPGIAVADQPHVFDRFWQVRQTARLGTGLGLAIVRSLAEAHGGRAGVESVPGAGSTFWFTLPALPDGVPQPGASSG